MRDRFKLDLTTDSGRTFRFVVIDEAFGRGPDDSTQFALAPFQRLGPGPIHLGLDTSKNSIAVGILGTDDVSRTRRTSSTMRRRCAG